MNIAVVGLGFMGSTHLKALKNISDARLAAVVSSDLAKLSGDLSSIQGNLGGPGEKFDFSDVKKLTKFEDLLSDPEIEAVDLCLPTDMHAPLTIAALKAGKHVLVEKPMALNAAECEAMMAAAAESGKLLMVAQVLRFIPPYVVLRNELKKTALTGPVRAALFRRRCAAPAWSKWLGDPARGGGGVFDLLIHDVDFCLHVFGNPVAYSATGYEDTPKGIDILKATLYYDGFTVEVNGGWHHPKSYPFSMEYTVVTNEATFEYSSEGRAPCVYRATGEEEVISLPNIDGFEGELRYFLECARTGAKPTLCPPEQSAAAVKLLLQLVEARKDPGAKFTCQL